MRRRGSASLRNGAASILKGSIAQIIHIGEAKETCFLVLIVIKLQKVRGVGNLLQISQDSGLTANPRL